jgi:primosomal protein N' (replication factor Y) (superfamily II helicase)
MLHTWVTPLIIQSSNTNSSRKSSTIYEQRDSSQIIIWTSLIATSNHEHQFDLLIYCNGDQWLSKPDFNASFDTFYSMYDGVRHHPHANIVIQSYSPEHEIFGFVGRADEAWFTQRDQSYKKQHSYPPYSQVCVLMYKHEVQTRVYRTVQKLFNELSYLREYHKRDDIQLYQTPPLVFKKFGKFHYHIILKWAEIRSFVDMAFPLCKIYERGFKVDREPRNLV